MPAAKPGSRARTRTSKSSARRYKVPAGRGVYLRKGNLVTLTSGPREGAQYRLETERYLTKVGSAENLRCYWRGRLFDN
jgi:hypothetical protein